MSAFVEGWSRGVVVGGIGLGVAILIVDAGRTVGLPAWIGAEAGILVLGLLLWAFRP